MNALEAQKQAIRDGVTLTDPLELWALGIPRTAWPRLVKKLGIRDPTTDVKKCAQARGLMRMIRGIDKLLALEPQYSVETRIGQKFGGDILPVNFPWSILASIKKDLRSITR